MCSSNQEFQLINPGTQVALYSHCIDDCLSNKYIQWNIYQGKINLFQNITEWILFKPNLLIFGLFFLFFFFLIYINFII